MATVYLIHFEYPIPRGTSSRGKQLVCGHYMGYSRRSLHERLQEHLTGNGSRLMTVIYERNISWALARTWSSGTRGLERRYKNWHNLPDLCPICKGEKPYVAYKGKSNAVTES